MVLLLHFFLQKCIFAYQGHLPLHGPSFQRVVLQTGGPPSPGHVPARSTGLPASGQMLNATAHS